MTTDPKDNIQQPLYDGLVKGYYVAKPIRHQIYFQKLFGDGETAVDVTDSGAHDALHAITEAVKKLAIAYGVAETADDKA